MSARYARTLPPQKQGPGYATVRYESNSLANGKCLKVVAKVLSGSVARSVSILLFWALNYWILN